MRKFTDIIERIEYVRTHLGLNKSRFSSEIGMKPQTYNNFIGSQGSKPNIELIFGIVNTFGVSPMWLLNATGPMFLEEAKSLIREGKTKPPIAPRTGMLGKVREEGTGMPPESRTANLEKLQEEIKTIEPLLQKVEAQIKRVELQHLPTLDRLIGILRRYYELDPIAAIEEFKETLGRIENRIEYLQTASKSE